MNWYSAGSGAAPERYITEFFPRASSMSFAARIDPSASPSGFSCVISRKRSWLRSASATAASSVVVWGELIDQLRHPDAALDRFIVFERQLRSSLQPELLSDSSLEDAVRRGETLQGLLPLGLRAEDADVDHRVPEVRRGLDGRDGDEPDPGVAQLADGLREDLTDRGVDAAHAVTHPALPPLARLAPARIPVRSGIEPPPRAVARPRGVRARRRRRSGDSAARGRDGRPRRGGRRRGSGAGLSPT